MITSKTVTAESIKTWAKPELVKLGQIADVAGSPSGITQNANKS